MAQLKWKLTHSCVEKLGPQSRLWNYVYICSNQTQKIFFAILLEAIKSENWTWKLTVDVGVKLGFKLGPWVSLFIFLIWLCLQIVGEDQAAQTPNTPPRTGTRGMRIKEFTEHLKLCAYFLSRAHLDSLKAGLAAALPGSNLLAPTWNKTVRRLNMQPHPWMSSTFHRSLLLLSNSFN